MLGLLFARAGSQPGLIELANAAAAKGEAELAARQAAVDRQAAAEVAAENGGSKEEQDKQQQEDLVSQRVPTFRIAYRPGRSPAEEARGRLRYNSHAVAHGLTRQILMCSFEY